MSDIEDATIDELIKEYEKSAALHREGLVNGDPKITNRGADRVARVYRELRRRGGSARDALLPLLLSDDHGIRKWAAAHALEFAPEQGKGILEAMSRETGLDGFIARMIIRVWRKGELRFP